ncbi:hypothetical protein ACFPOB_26270 [Bosea eneae]|uniref:Chemotaxis protein n=1 Tax=Bosea eneae TaxID=151454 RepID=A0ABW0J0V9_9HYPH
MPDAAGFTNFLLGLGPPGAIILYLLWRMGELEKALKAANERHLGFVESMTEKVATALVASTDAMRANTAVQDKAADSARSLAEAVRGIDQRLEHLDETLDRSQRGRRA